MLDCVIVGAGHSGLCAAKRLDAIGVSYVVLDRQRIGEAWHSRMPDMKLFTSREFCSLPGMSFPGEQSSYPNAPEMARYLSEYAKLYKLNVEEYNTVVDVRIEGSIFYTRTLEGKLYKSKTVINATGPNQTSIIPRIGDGASQHIKQMTACSFSSEEIPEGHRVLVVGDGASGRQIAGKLASHVHVMLATGSKRGLPPNRVLGRDLFWWLKKTGVIFADTNSLVGKILQKRNPVPCRDFNNRKLADLGVKIHGRLESIEGSYAVFKGGQQKEIDAVIWAVGYQDNTDWLNIPGCIEEGVFKESYGCTQQPGLYVVGRKWLTCRASELIMGSENDVGLVVGSLSTYLKNVR